jgi:hypothetical protein
MIDTIEALTDRVTDVRPALAAVLIIRAEKKGGLVCLACINKIIEIVPKDVQECVLFLFDCLSRALWQDHFLPIVVALFSPMTDVWHSLFMLSKRLVSAGDVLIANIFIKVINHDTIPNFGNFLVRMMKWPGRHHYHQVINGLLLAFSAIDICFASGLAQKAIRYLRNNNSLQALLPPNAVPICAD